jgi:hypothetical protein
MPRRRRRRPFLSSILDSVLDSILNSSIFCLCGLTPISCTALPFEPHSRLQVGYLVYRALGVDMPRMPPIRKVRQRQGLVITVFPSNRRSRSGKDVGDDLGCVGRRRFEEGRVWGFDGAGSERVNRPYSFFEPAGSEDLDLERRDQLKSVLERDTRTRGPEDARSEK